MSLWLELEIFLKKDLFKRLVLYFKNTNMDESLCLLIH